MSQEVVKHEPRGVQLSTLDELEKFAGRIAKTEFIPAPFRGKPADVVVALEYALEVGLAPLRGLQSIAVINGKPSLYGEAPLALVRKSGLLETFKEWWTDDPKKGGLTAWCEAKRKGEPNPVRRKFSVAMAKTAKLYGKAGPWTLRMERMLQMRARSWCLNDAFPDVLQGIAQGEVAEDWDETQRGDVGELPDIPTVEVVEPDAPAEAAEENEDAEPAPDAKAPEWLGEA